MAFSKQQRKGLVDQIVANNDFSEEALETLTDNQLVALLEPTKLDELVNNAMPPQLQKAMKKKKEETMNEDMEDDMEDEMDSEDDMEEEEEEEEEALPKKKPPMTTMKKGYNKKGMSTNAWLAGAPPEVRRLVANAQRAEAEKRNQLVETIVANQACPLTEKQLQTRSLEDLEVFAAMAKTSSSDIGIQSAGFDFFGAAGGPVVNSRSVQNAKPLALPGADYMKK
jgi:hypothetical protein